MDLFVMVVSVGLSMQFKRLNRDLMRVKGRVKLFFIIITIHHFFD